MFVEETGEFTNDSFVQRKLKNAIKVKRMWKNFASTSSVLNTRSPSLFIYLVFIILNAIANSCFYNSLLAKNHIK